jgi:type II secretory pathway pseudopilin PulG
MHSRTNLLGFWKKGEIINPGGVFGGKMKEQGISHIELIVAMAIVGVLVSAEGFEYYDWGKKVAAERVIKVLYSNIMMHARMMAATRGREHHVVLGNTAYWVVKDTNASGIKDGGDVTLPDFPKKVEASLSRNNTGNDVTFDKRGIMPKWRTIRVASATDADYDCIAVSTTRIIMGQYVKCQPK